MKTIERLLVPTDRSAGAEAAAEMAAQLGRQLGAEIDVVTVVDTSTFAEIYGDAAYRMQRIRELRAQAEAETRQIVDRCFGGLAKVRVHVREGTPHLEILEAARELGSDLVVMGTHGRTGLAHLLIGSVAEKVVQESHTPVITVHASH